MTNYKLKCFYILITIAPSLCQFAVDNGLKPDVVFGEHNDRFDVTSLIRRQKKLYENQNIMDRQSEEYRRKGQRRETQTETTDKDSWLDLFSTKRDRLKFRKKLVKHIESQANEIANTLINRIRAMRRSNGDFAAHDDMASGGGDAQEYEKNLENMDNIHNFKETVEDTRRLQNIVNKLHGHETRRIVGNPENEILLHYALPVDLNIEGFLQAPLKE